MAPKRDKSYDGFLLLTAPGLNWGEDTGEGGCTDRQNWGLGPVDGDGLRLRVYSSQSFLLSLRGRKAPSFTTNTPPTPGSQGKAKVEGGGGGSTS